MPRKNFMVTALYDVIKTSHKFIIMDTYNKTQTFPESFFTLNKTCAKYGENSMSQAKIPGVQTLWLQCKFHDYTCVYMPLGASYRLPAPKLVCRCQFDGTMAFVEIVPAPSWYDRAQPEGGLWKNLTTHSYQIWPRRLRDRASWTAVYADVESYMTDGVRS